jgi:hypothetical protein
VSFLDAIAEPIIETRECVIDWRHGMMQLGADGREFCPVCLYVPCACDGS